MSATLGVSCLNRDDVGAPKSAIFGGCNRARISSQCLKRAVRELAQEMAPQAFSGRRSRLIIQPLIDGLVGHGVSEDVAAEAARAAGDYLATFDEERAAKDGTLQVKTLMFLSPGEIAAVAAQLAAAISDAPGLFALDASGAKEDKKKAKTRKNAISKVCRESIKSVQLKDAADIAIFGRMVASDHTLTVEGAGMFSHALSTHRADNDIDFFSAVDDLKPDSAEDAGAGHTGILEFTSACYYRYVGLNLDLLKDADHLGGLTAEERRAVVETFLRAALVAVPGARRNSMNAHTLPTCVLGTVKHHGQPVQLVNAFELPVRGRDGLAAASTAAMVEHHAHLKSVWGIETAAEFVIPEVSLASFCQGLIRHVD